LDRSSLAAPISRPASTLIPSGMRGYAPDLDGIQSFDAAAARAGLEASRVPRGDLDGVKLLARDTPTGRAAAGFVQKQLKQNLDLSVSIDSVSSAETMSKRLADRDFQFTVPAGWEADYPDQQDWFDRFRSDDGNNISQWRNPRYDQLVDLADGTADDVVRDQLYRQAHRVLLAEAPIVVIEQPLQPLLQRRRVSTGLNTPFDDAGLPGDLHSESIEIGQH
jgi:oligopeptide transport system substrate-binding protein